MAAVATLNVAGSSLKCSSCYAPLRVSDGVTAPTVLVCGYCGTATRLNDARSWAEEVNRWLERRFGEHKGDVMDAAADVTLRSYVFQRDVVDYLAERFMNTAKFLNPVLSSPDGASPPTLREEMEFGLELDDYLQSLALDTALPDHAEIRSLAGTPVDLQEARSQACKLRALSCFARGLLQLNRAATLNSTGSSSPISVREFEGAELYFEGSLKACREGQEGFPDDPFYGSFGSFVSGATHFVRAIRLHSIGYAFDGALALAQQGFGAVVDNTPLSLDQSRRAAIFADPSKARIRGKVESNFHRAASDNLHRVSRYRDEVLSLPGRVRELATTLRNIVSLFLTSRALSFKLGAGLLGDILGLSGTLVAGASSLPSVIVPLAILGLIGLVLGVLLSRERERQGSLRSSYRNAARTVGNPLYTRISLLTGHSNAVVFHYLAPCELLHGFFTGRVLPIRWIASRTKLDALLEELASLPLVPGPFDRAAPLEVAEPKKDRPDEAYRAHFDSEQEPPSLAFPFVS